MPALTAHTALIGATTSTSNTTYTDVTASISGTMKASTKYLVMCSAHVTSTSNARPWKMRLIERSVVTGVVEIDTSEVIREATTVGKTNPYMWTGIYTTTATAPNDGGIILQQAVTNGVDTVETEYVSLIAIELSNLTEGTDYFVSSDSTAITETESLVERVSHTLNPSTTGPWFVLAFVSTNVEDVNGSATNVVFTQTTTTSSVPTATVASNIRFEGEDLTEVVPTVQAWAENYSGVDSVEWKIETKSILAGGSDSPNKYLASSIVGLRLGALQNNSIDATVTPVDTTSGDFVDRFSANTITPTTTGTVVFVGTQNADLSSTGRSFFTRVQVDDGGGYESIPNAAQSDTESWVTYDPADILTTMFCATHDVVAETDYDFKYQYKETYSPSSCNEAAFVAFTLEQAPEVMYSSEAAEIYMAGVEAGETYMAGSEAGEITG